MKNYIKLAIVGFMIGSIIGIILTGIFSMLSKETGNRETCDWKTGEYGIVKIEKELTGIDLVGDYKFETNLIVVNVEVCKETGEIRLVRGKE